MDNSPAIFTLTTDFGLQDPYVGQLKGAILKGCPAATIIDLTHAIPAWDVVTAAVTIRTSYRYFPAGTVHVIVVDPGVGSERAVLAAAGDGHFFVAPDNGCLSLLGADQRIESIYRVDQPAYFAATISPTFHGRDIMAPVAAALARTGDLTQFGPAVELANIRMVIAPAVIRAAGSLQGQVQRIDHFGNIRTTIRAGSGRFDPAALAFVEIGDQRISRWVRSYHEAEPGVLLVLIDSSGYLEIAANQASASELIGCAPGDPVTVHLVRKETK
jgi:S-adenosylmethionine hydrolase